MSEFTLLCICCMMSISLYLIECISYNFNVFDYFRDERVLCVLVRCLSDFQKLSPTSGEFIIVLKFELYRTYFKYFVLDCLSLNVDGTVCVVCVCVCFALWLFNLLSIQIFKSQICYFVIPDATLISIGLGSSLTSCVYILLICVGCYNKTPQPGWIIQQKLIFSQLQRIIVQVQGVRLVSDEVFLPCIQCLHILSWIFTQKYLSFPFSFQKDISSIRLRHTLFPHLTLIKRKALSKQCHTGIKTFSTQEFWGHRIQSITYIYLCIYSSGSFGLHFLNLNI